MAARAECNDLLKRRPEALHANWAWKYSVDVPGYAASDVLKKNAQDLVTQAKELSCKKNAWIQVYLLHIAMALTVLGTLAGNDGKEIKSLPPSVRQKVLVAMDVLAGVLAYGMPWVREQFDKETRRTFLYVGRKAFVSEMWARKAQKQANGFRAMRVTEVPQDHITSFS